MTDALPSSRVRDLRGLRVLVAGLGVTGRAATAALRAGDASVTTIDDAADDADLHDQAAVDLDGVDLVVASPGWRPTSPVLVAAAERGLAVWSEVELAWRLRVDRARGDGPAPWLAVTGTNGKTTTVGMLASIGTAAGLDLPAVGNVGTPVVEAALDPAHDALAVELSSFQLHFTHSMTARAAAILNVAPDHLDWHGSFEQYAAAKARIYRGAQVACVYDTADPLLESLVRRADVAEGARAVGVTLGAPGPGQLGVVDGVLVDRAFHLPADHPTRRASAAELGTFDDLAHLAGPDGRLAPHVVSNALAAAALGRAHGVPAEAVRDGLRAYRPGAHRVELVAISGGVAYVDDSKATNAHAAAASLVALRPGQRGVDRGRPGQGRRVRRARAGPGGPASGRRADRRGPGPTGGRTCPTRAGNPGPPGRSHGHWDGDVPCRDRGPSAGPAGRHRAARTRLRVDGPVRVLRPAW